jgi:hypothetical protein
MMPTRTAGPNGELCGEVVREPGPLGPVGVLVEIGMLFDPDRFEVAVRIESEDEAGGCRFWRRGFEAYMAVVKMIGDIGSAKKIGLLVKYCV